MLYLEIKQGYDHRAIDMKTENIGWLGEVDFTLCSLI